MPMRLIDDRFEIGELAPGISQRGKAVTYQARDRSTGKEMLACALKPSLMRDPGARAAFLSGIEMIGRLDHPNIVRVHASFEDKEREEILYITDVFQGVSLARMLREGAVFSERQAVAIATSILDALEQAHDRNVGFGNIKPSNILVSHDRESACIITLPKPPFEFTSIRQLGAYIGYPQECPPEFLLTGTFGFLADLYGVGLILYEMCLGSLPSSGVLHLSDLFDEIISQELPPPAQFLPQMNQRLNQIIMRAVSKNPDQRFSCASEMKSALTKVQTRTVPLLTGDRLASLVTSQMPFPVAHAFRSIDRQIDEIGQLQRVIDTSQVVIQTLGSIRIAEALAAGAQPPIADAEARNNFARPSLGHWAQIVREIGKDVPPRVVVEIPEFVKSPAHRELEKLVSLRNEVRHGANPTPGAARRMLEAARPELENLLAGLLFLRHYRLWIPRRLNYHEGKFVCDIEVLRGTDIAPELTAVTLSQPVSIGQVYLSDASFGRLLCLHPLLLYHTCSICEDEELFYYESAGDMRVHYLSFTKGHSLSLDAQMLTFEKLGLLRN